jgi:hypothetical protein
VQAKKGSSRLDKIVIVALLVGLLAVVSGVSLAYFALSQPNQTSNNPSLTSTPSPSPGGEPVGTGSVPKPSMPEFTLKYVDTSYDVPSTTTTTTDPYTGKQTVTTTPSYHVENGTVEVTIENQEFTPYLIDNQRTIYLFYNVSYKGHYEEEWTYYPSGSYTRDSTRAVWIRQSSSECTVVSFKAPPEGQMDFRVQAQIGYYTESQLLVPVPGAPFSYYTFTGEVSGWSTTQTVTIP